MKPFHYAIDRCLIDFVLLRQVRHDEGVFVPLGLHALEVLDKADVSVIGGADAVLGHHGARTCESLDKLIFRHISKLLDVA